MYANIVQAVKKCYKQNFDSGVYGSVFLYVTGVADAIYLVILGFFALQRDYIWSAKKPFCFAKRLLLQCK